MSRGAAGAETPDPENSDPQDNKLMRKFELKVPLEFPQEGAAALDDYPITLVSTTLDKGVLDQVDFKQSTWTDLGAYTQEDSDLPSELQVKNGAPRLQTFATAIPNQLLLVSLLEHLCYVHEQNPHRSRGLFKLLCQTFTGMGLLSSFAFSDEFSSVRLHHSTAITELLKAAKLRLHHQQTLCVDRPSKPRHIYADFLVNHLMHPSEQKLANPANAFQELGNGELYLHSSRVKHSLFEAQTSRYLNEFEEIKQLGKGGYGKVYRVRNKLDGQFYAIKKILIKKATRKDCMKVLREVKVLAGLQHANIVGYHTAWMEHMQPPPPRSKPMPVSKIEVLTNSSDYKPGREKNGIRPLDGSSSSIIFAESHSGEAKASEDASMEILRNDVVQSNERIECSGAAAGQHMNTNNSSLPSAIDEECLQNANQERAVCFMAQSQELLGWRKKHHFNQETDSLSSSDSSSEDGCPQKEMCLHRQCEMQYHLMLHIQMKLCELSLWDWIVSRNGEHGRGKAALDPYQLVDAKLTMKIFKEVLEGVYYIHTMGILHRDLKRRCPHLDKADLEGQNGTLFTCGRHLVRQAGVQCLSIWSVIGVALYGVEYALDCIEPRNIFLHGPDLHVQIGDFGLACRDMLQDESAPWLKTDRTHGSVHTSGVGTSLYAAPEQLQGSHYDFKSDMYSVGMILLELYQPFGTEMERNEVLTALRSGHVPNAFSAQWPVQTKYVKLLTSTESSQRPSATHILESELFHNSENVITNLQKKVVQQEEEIEKLKERIQLLLRERGDQHLEKPEKPL